jgi:hypothetical protein
MSLLAHWRDIPLAALENDGMELAARLGEAEEQIALGGK